MSKNIPLSLLLVALLSSANANETKSIELKPLSITSTAIETDELRSTDAVEVYTQKDIEDSHVQNVYEFLNTQTSVFTTSGNGNPFVQKLDMRGYGVGDGYQNIVVTINGRKMNNVDMVAPLLSSISPTAISKIEIIKSSGIVVGGDGANAGVINITTKKNNDKSLTLYGGSYGVIDGAFYLGHSDDKLSISLNGEMQKNNGIRSIDTGAKDENKFSTFNLSLAYNATKDLEIHTDLSTTHTDVIYAGSMTQDEYNQNSTQQGTVDYGFGGGPIPSSSTHQTYDSNVIIAGLKYYINNNLTLKTDVSQEKKESDFITYSSIYNYDYTTLRASLDYDSDIVAISAGVDGFDGNMVKQDSILDLTKTNKAAFIMTQFYLNTFTFKAGLRHEKINLNQKNGFSESESLNGAELGVNYQLSNTQSLFANYSHSYQSASLDRLVSFFSPLSQVDYVEPSQANSYNIGFNSILPTNKFKISLFYIDLENEIYYGPFTSKNTNIDKSHKYGLDVYDKYLLSQEFNIALNYNYVQAIIDEEIESGNNYANNDLPGVSDHNLKLTLNYLPNTNTTVSLTQIYRSEAYAAEDFNNNFSQKQEAHKSTNISIAYVTKGYEVFAKINNLFNQSNGIWIKDDAIYPVNFTTTAIAGFKVRF